MRKPKEGWDFWSFPWGEIFRSITDNKVLQLSFYVKSIFWGLWNIEIVILKILSLKNLKKVEFSQTLKG